MWCFKTTKIKRRYYHYGNFFSLSYKNFEDNLKVTMKLYYASFSLFMQTLILL